MTSLCRISQLLTLILARKDKDEDKDEEQELRAKTKTKTKVEIKTGIETKSPDATIMQPTKKRKREKRRKGKKEKKRRNESKRIREKMRGVHSSIPIFLIICIGSSFCALPSKNNTLMPQD